MNYKVQSAGILHDLSFNELLAFFHTLSHTPIASRKNNCSQSTPQQSPPQPTPPTTSDHTNNNGNNSLPPSAYHPPLTNTSSPHKRRPQPLRPPPPQPPNHRHPLPRPLRRHLHLQPHPPNLGEIRHRRHPLRLPPGLHNLTCTALRYTRRARHRTLFCYCAESAGNG